MTSYPINPKNTSWGVWSFINNEMKGPIDTMKFDSGNMTYFASNPSKTGTWVVDSNLNDRINISLLNSPNDNYIVFLNEKRFMLLNKNDEIVFYGIKQL